MRNFRAFSMGSVAAMSIGALPLLVGIGHAAPMVFVANMSGANENPATNSQGSGTAVVIVDPAANTLDVTVVFNGLTGNTTASHIHCCEATPGANVNVSVATTTPTFAGFPLGVTSGSYHSVLDLTQASSYNPAFISGSFDPTHTVAGAESALIAGIVNAETYLNVHSTVFPGGEIRGVLLAPHLSPMVAANAGANAIAAAGAVDAVIAAGSAPLEFVGLLSLPQNGLTTVLQQVAGGTGIETAQAGHESIRQFLAMVLDPFAGTRPVQPGNPGGGVLWGGGYGSRQTIAANAFAGTTKQSNDGGGVAVGYDMMVAPDTGIGAAFLYDHRSFGDDGDFATGSSDGYHFAVHGDVDTGMFYLRAAGVYSIFDARNSRNLSASGLSGNYQASYTAHGYGGRAEVGLHLGLGLLDATPFAAVVADSISLPAFNETTRTGASVFALHERKHSFDRTRGEFGIGFDNILPAGGAAPVVFNIRAGWAHEFTTPNSATLSFAQFPGENFVVTGSRMRDSGFASVGLAVAIGPGVTLGGSFSADFGSAFSFGGNAELRFAF